MSFSPANHYPRIVSLRAVGVAEEYQLFLPVGDSCNGVYHYDTAFTGALTPRFAAPSGTINNLCCAISPPENRTERPS